MAAEYEVFISQASEDKEEVARPLANELRSRGRTVWYDEDDVGLGDSLPQSIDAGLARARFGAVILSSSFLEKRWTRYELDGLTAREMAPGGRKHILPVWHNVTYDDVAARSPSIAARRAVNTDIGVAAIADEIESVLDAPSPTAFTQGAGDDEDRAFESPIAAEWADRAAIQTWTAWTEGLFWPNPFLAVDDDERLRLLGQWLTGRYWPRGDHPIAVALQNFEAVLNDLRDVFHRDADIVAGNIYRVRSFYKPPGGGPHIHRLVEVFEKHQRLIWNLAAELTRAGNLVLDRARELDPGFCAVDGVLTVLAGGEVQPAVVPRYRAEGAVRERAYPGLDGFVEQIAERDGSFGALGPQDVAAYDPRAEP